MRFLALAVVLVFGLDLATTFIAFKHGATEANVLLSGLAFWEIALAKCFVLVFVALSTLFPGKTEKSRKWSFYVAAFAVFATWGVTASNIVQLASFVNGAYAFVLPTVSVLLAVLTFPALSKAKQGVAVAA